ncbi:oligosaccharide flippase family protein [Pseudoalteromonas luteoviolacea]|uniref:oligosaccharide flippase family protein n=1 Tax=Pseudoalteromonas luteoviolacea TaxID=43657 RepID=UPI001F44A22A|nr:oligosaccharide flippase family protein [Pseudoalteromonas luteoviolacea]MCF6442801.1 oligosaccharide flippase family protein [Pseudoalteromonas luteoviolacea]
MQSNKHSLKLLLRNTSWLVGAEVVAKATRLLSIMAMAAFLVPVEYGAAMLALSIHEVIRLLLRSGTGAQIIRAKENELPDYLSNGLCIQWLLCIALFFVQLLAAYATQWLFPEHDITTLVALMAFTYLVFPIVSTRAFLVQRDNRMALFSMISSCCIILENITIAVALYFDAGLLSIVYAKWAFALLWLGAFSLVDTLPHKIGFKRDTFFYLLGSSTQLAAAEGLRSLRMNMDIFIGARLLSPELFGLYSFAKSAGIGLAMSISQAYITALYPYVCQQQKNAQTGNLNQKIMLVTAAVSAIFVCQSVLVPVYVPFLFSADWQASFTTTSLLCLIAITTVWSDTYSAMLRSKGLFKLETQQCAFCLIVSIIGVLAIAPQQPDTFALVLLLSSILWLVFPAINVLLVKFSAIKAA